MKVYISKYRRHWLSPYTIYEKLVFWRKVDILNLSKREEKFIDFLNPICVWLQDVLDFVHPKIDYVKIDHYDTWSMDRTLAQIILPMLKQLKETKHGVPAEFVHGKNGDSEIPFEEAEKKWNAAMDQMIWSFEQLLDENNDEQFFTDDPDGKPNESLKSLLRDDYIPQKYDREGHMKHQKKIQKGLNLFGKHYLSLWD